jgi:hypothetical protein
VLFDLGSLLDQRLSHHVKTTEDQLVEYEEMQRLAMAAMLERVWNTLTEEQVRLGL